MKTHGPLHVATFVEPSFQQNGFLLWTGAGRSAWVIDPSFPPQCDALIRAVRERELELAAIIITHCHADHIAGVPAVQAAFPDAALWAPAGEEHMLVDAVENLSALLGNPITTDPADRALAPGDVLTLSNTSFEVRDVAGHSPGGRALYCADAGVVFVGDALFDGSVGRVDFPGSSGARLLGNIRANLLSLPDETVVYSGHGPPTTIGNERATNPFLQPGAAPW